MALQITGNNSNGSPQLSLCGGNSTLFSFNPFGEGATRTGAATSLPGFNGERQDPLSGVSHLGNGYRAYSPALRRFTCPDSESPFGVGGINPYVYCDHDPVNFTDPDGHMGKLLKESDSSWGWELHLSRKQRKAMRVGLPPQGTDGAGTSSSSRGATGTLDDVAQERRTPTTTQQALRVADEESNAQGTNARRGRRDGATNFAANGSVSEIQWNPSPFPYRVTAKFQRLDEETNYGAWKWDNHCYTHRNIAFLEYDIDGNIGSLYSISGKEQIKEGVRTPIKRFYAADDGTRNIEYDTRGRGYDTQDRTYDTEVKLLEYFTAKFVKAGQKGNISIYSELNVCRSCTGVIEQFTEKHPGFKVTVYEQGGINRKRPQGAPRRR